ncbi:MAG: PAS domain-containing protein [Candidatus Faecousia sp.]|nr:PAS domain-containing protein [Candidatus Faecousia sp.]
MNDRNLTAEDLRILDSYKTLAEGLAAYLGGSYEVAVHSLGDFNHSVIRIMNGFHTGRTEGSPITDLGISMLKKLEANDSDRDYQVYFSKNTLGEPMKSTTIAIRGKGRRIIGLLCINLYLGTPLLDYLSELLPQDSSVFTAENFAQNSVNAVEQKLHEAKNQVMNDASILPSMRNKEIIRLLQSRHVFELKNSVELVANGLGISVNTVYFHLRNLTKIPGCG